MYVTVARTAISITPSIRRNEDVRNVPGDHSLEPDELEVQALGFQFLQTKNEHVMASRRIYI